jgi:intein/homing endonuclease
MNADVRLRNGHRLRGTGTVLCAREGRLLDVDVRDLVVGDWVGLGYDDPESFPRELVQLGEFSLSPPHGSQKRVKIPEVLDEDLALLLGMYASEGHTSRSIWSVVITNGVPAVLERAAELWKTCFDVDARVAQYGEKCGSTIASSKTIVEVMNELGCGARASEKRVPFEIMQSPRPVVISFLRGVWLDAYTSVAGMHRWGLCLDSPEFLDDVQTLLRRLGVVTGRITKYNPVYDKSYDEIYAAGGQARRLVQLVPFLEPYKALSASRLLEVEGDTAHNGADVVPLVHGSRLYAEIPRGHSGAGGAGTGVAVKWRTLCDKRTVWPSRRIVQRIAEAGYRLPPDVQRVLDENLHFSPVVRIVA